ncbi:hypothetical protein TgHK011_007534 [Trichoderma gracile]|nr:hypothetical protein TgHK011_007534 [Trichoderma gracile]
MAGTLAGARLSPSISSLSQLIIIIIIQPASAAAPAGPRLTETTHPQLNNALQALVPASKPRSRSARLLPAIRTATGRSLGVADSWASCWSANLGGRLGLCRGQAGGHAQRLAVGSGLQLLLLCGECQRLSCPP